LNAWKYAAKSSDIVLSQGLFVWRAPFAWVIDPATDPTEERVLTPGLTKDGNSSRVQDPLNFTPGCNQVEMVEDGVAPNAIEGGVLEWQSCAVGLNEINGNAVDGGSVAGFRKVGGRKVKGGDSRAPAGQDNRGHSMATTKVQDTCPPHVAQVVYGWPDPGFMVEVAIIVEAVLPRMDMES
jgi:hypothetical protein